MSNNAPSAEHIAHESASGEADYEAVTRIAKAFQELRLLSEFTSPPVLLSTDEVEGGQLERYGFVTEAGFAYDGVIGIPKEPQTPVPFIGTTAWLTSTRGHNEHTARRAIKEGIPWIFVGGEGSFRPKLRDAPIPQAAISLAGSAAAALAFGHYASETHKYLLDPTERALLGESRGGMVGGGILALDKVFNQNIVYADLTAPCFPRGIEAGDFLRMSGHIFSEPKSVAKMASRFTLKQIIHYPATIDPHPYSLAHQIAMAPALFNGEAGQLADLIPADKVRHITCYHDDFASMPDEWQKKVTSHPGVRITLLEGSHLTIADPETLDFIMARNAAYRELAKSGEVDGQEMFDLAHSYTEAA